MAIAARAHTKTAPAAMSFTCPAIGFRCGDTKSTSRSMAELNSSAAITRPMHRMTISHSVRVISKAKPAMVTQTVVIR